MKILQVLAEIYETPSILEREVPDILAFLSAKCGKKGQSLSNNIPMHEACFADLLNKNGFLFLNKNIAPLLGYPCYHHQLGGNHTKVDFVLYETVGTCIVSVKFDLKHTNTKTFYLNDGWFHTDTIYIINWTLKKKHSVLIACGNEIPTKDEESEMRELLELKKRLNTEQNNVGSLVKYIRFANQYKCDMFTPEFAESRFQSVSAFLSSMSQPSESASQEQHSQSALPPKD